MRTAQFSARLLTAILMFVAITVSRADELARTKPIDISSRLELFVDQYLIDTLQGVTRELHFPERQGPVMTFDRPWEGAGTNNVTVFADVTPGGDPYYRMYYRGNRSPEQAPDLGGLEVTCYAESSDGIHWTRPDLRIFRGEFTSSSGLKANVPAPNNIVWIGQGTQVHSNHNFSPFKDTNPACIPEARYKAIGRWLNTPDASPPRPDQTGYPWPHGAGLVAFQSPDGIHWTLMRDKRIIKKTETDSHNVAFWDTVQGQRPLSR